VPIADDRLRTRTMASSRSESVAMGVADDTMKVGLLMEAAQAQQSLAATTLDKLREHTAGLDAIVREEIRATVLNELHALTEDSRHAAAALRRLQRVANLRLVAWSIGVLTLAAIAPLGIAWYLLPTPASVATLKATRDQLTSNIDRLSHQGARMELRRCGDAQRLCVRVDRSAPAYGAGADFFIVKGY
jgi:hypothetical protein